MARSTLIQVVFACLALHVRLSYADENDDFVNNLLTDLAPLITLFGEKVAMQFMSQSMGLADSIVLALAPIGVLTIVVSAIRVGGPVWLKAIIGRARENFAAAEIELTSSTSKEVCELWNGRNVVRCQGSASTKIWEFICLVPDQTGQTQCPLNDSGLWKVKCMNLKTAAKKNGPLKSIDISYSSKLKKQSARFFASSKEKLSFQNNLEDGADIHTVTDLDTDGDDDMEGNYSIEGNVGIEAISKIRIDGHTVNDSQTILVLRDQIEDAPNISLNCHDKTSRWEIVLVAIFGIILQTSVLVFSGYATLHPSFASHFRKNGRPAASYAFPMTVCGTVALTIGILICGIVVEESSQETHYAVNKNNDDYKNHSIYMVWLQKGSTINDQEFKPFALFPKKKRQFVTVSRRRLEKTNGKDGENGDEKEQDDLDEENSFGLERLTAIGCITALAGFALQFTGLRGLSYIAAVAQLIVMAIMTGLRTFIRRGLAEPPFCRRITPDYELDWFAKTFNDREPCWMRKNKDKKMQKDANWNRQDSIVSQPQPYKVPRQPRRSRNERGLFKHKLRRFHNANEELSHRRGENALKNRRKLGTLARWSGPALTQAVRLAGAIEAAAGTMLEQQFSNFTWFLEIYKEDEMWKLPLSVKQTVSPRKHTTSPKSLEAALSLWLSCTMEANFGVHGKRAPKNLDRLRLRGTFELGLRLFHPTLKFCQVSRDIKAWMHDDDVNLYMLRQDHHPRRIDYSMDGLFISMQAPCDRIVGYLPQQKMPCGMMHSKKHNTHMATVQSLDLCEPFSFSPRFFFRHENKFLFRNKTVQDRIALKSHDKTERLFARHLFSGFIEAVASKNKLWKSKLSNFQLVDGRITYQLLNPKLSKTLEQISKSGFINLKEATLDVIVPLSILDKLSSVSIMLNLMQNEVKKLLRQDMESAIIFLMEILIIGLENNLALDSSVPYAMIIWRYHAYMTVYRVVLEKREGRVRLLGHSQLFETLVQAARYVKKRYPVLSERFNVFKDQFLVYDLNRRRTHLPKPCKVTTERCREFELKRAHLEAMEFSGEFPPDAGFPESQDVLGWTPLHYLIAAGRSDNHERRRFLTETNHAQAATCADVLGFTPLHFACSQGQVEEVKVLIRAGASPRAQQEYGITPLHIAASLGDAKIVNLLLRKLKADRQGGEMAGPRKRGHALMHDFNERLPIHWAAIKGHAEVVRLLIGDFAAKDVFGFTCYHLAVIYGQGEVMGVVEAMVKMARDEVLDLAVARAEAEEYRRNSRLVEPGWLEMMDYFLS